MQKSSNSASSLSLVSRTGTGSYSDSMTSRTASTVSGVHSFSISSNGWSGINMTANAYGFDDIYSGTPYGIGEYGGIVHFK